MVSKSWVACAALLTLLSGCINDAPGTDPVTQPLEGLDGDTNETVEQVVNNTAPMALLDASTTNGTAPLNITFTLDGNDADGDNLTWTFTVGNQTLNGTTLPATINQSLIAGNHTAILVVSDGNMTGNATLLIQVAEAEEIVGEVDDGLCHRSSTFVGGMIHMVEDGGTWFFLESNGVPGLQVANNHPVGDPLWVNPDWVDCLNGDSMIN